MLKHRNELWARRGETKRKKGKTPNKALELYSLLPKSSVTEGDWHRKI